MVLVDSVPTVSSTTLAARAMAALPIGLSEGCVLRRDVSKDSALSFDDVEALPDGLVLSLWREQNARWPVASAEALPAEPDLAGVNR